MKLASRAIEKSMQATAAIEDGRPKSWQDYENEVSATREQTRKMSKAALDRGVQSTLRDASGGVSASGLRKSAQAFVGPIMLRLKYEGVLRDVLLEKPLAQGELPIYDFFNNLGMGWALNDYSGQYQIERMEAGKLDIPLLRIGQAVTVPQAEVRAFSFDLIERIKQQMIENIMRKEDQRLFAAIDLAISDHARYELGPEYVNFPDINDYSQENIGPFSHMTFANAFATISRAQLAPSKILINIGDYYDVFNWGVNTISYAAVERITDTGVMSNYGPAMFRPSVTVKKGVAYVLPEPEYVGYVPIGYGVQVNEVHNPLADQYGYVASELLGYGVASAFGLHRTVKVAA